MDLVTLRAIVQHRLEFAEALCQEVEVQSEGHWLNPAKNKLTRPLWSVTFATKWATLPETVSEGAVGLKSAVWGVWSVTDAATLQRTAGMKSPGASGATSLATLPRTVKSQTSATIATRLNTWLIFSNWFIVCLLTSLSQRGHMSRDCPDGDLKTCFKCGGKGHIALDCPSPANSKKGEKGSGADEVLEPEDLWAAIDVAKVEIFLSVAYMAVGVCRSVILDNIHNITLMYSKLTLVTYFVRHYTWFLSK